MSLDPVVLHKHTRQLASERLERHSGSLLKRSSLKSLTVDNSKRQSMKESQPLNNERTLQPTSTQRQQQREAQRLNSKSYASPTVISKSKNMLNLVHSQSRPDTSTRQKENNVPSYLRGTASSILKAEHNTSQTKLNKLLSNSTLRSTKERSISTRSLNHSRSNILSNSSVKHGSRQRVDGSYDNDTSSTKSRDTSKLSYTSSRHSSSVSHVSSRRPVNLKQRSRKAKSYYYKELPHTPASRNSSHNSSNIPLTTDSTSLQDIEIVESLKKDIPSEFINLSDGSFELSKSFDSLSVLDSPIASNARLDMSQKGGSLHLRSVKSEINKKRLPTSRVEPDLVKPSAPREEGGSGNSSIHTISPSRLKAPTVTLKKSDSSITTIDNAKIASIQHTASTINLNKNTPASNQISKSISMTGVHTKVRTTSNSSIPTKISQAKGPKTTDKSFNLQPTDDIDYSFLKELSFDSAITPMFDTFNDFKLNDSIPEIDPEPDTSLSRSDSKQLLGAAKVVKSPIVTKAKTSPIHNINRELKTAPSKQRTDNTLAGSLTTRNFTAISEEETFENKSCIPINIDKSLFEGNSRHFKLLKGHTHRISSLNQDSNNKHPTSVSSDNSSSHIRKSVTVHNMTGKSIMKAAKGKYNTQKADTLNNSRKLMQNFSRKSAKGSKYKEKKISNARQLYNALLRHDETNEILKNWTEYPKPVTLKPALASELIAGKRSDWLRKLTRPLNVYEKGELSRKTHVYYVRLSDSARINMQISNFKQNFGYDDENQNYITIAGDHIDYRYEILQILGNGSFGNVLKCFDHKTNKVVAIKIIKNDMQWSLQAVYEIKVLKSLSRSADSESMASRERRLLREQTSNENNFILNYIDHFNFRSHMCIVTELLSVNLFQAVQSSSFYGFGIEMVMKWSFQLMKALKFIHGHSVIHCDLKPENIMLISPDTLDIKIIDFGSACYVNETSYSYIQSRFYRAPEVLIGARYSTAIDIWSAGCILAELFIGTPIFSGQDENEQLALSVEVLGPPPRKTILNLRKELKEKGTIDKVEENQQPYTLIDLSFDKNGSLKPTSMVLKGKRRFIPSSRQLSDILGPTENRVEEMFLSFISLCLEWDAFARVTAGQLLDHPFLRYYSENDILLEKKLYGKI